MKNKLYITFIATALACAALLHTSCSRNEMVTPVGGTVQVELSAQIKHGKGGKPLSRAMTRVVGNQWELNDMVGIFMIADDGTLPSDLIADPLTSNNYDNCRYKIVEGPGISGFKLTAATQEDYMYYPENGDIVDFIAYYPYRSTLTGYKYPLDIKNQDGSINHDLLYSTNATGSVTSATGDITFYHKLSKLIVKLKPLKSSLDLSGMTGKVEGVPVTGDFSLIDSTFTIATLGAIDVPNNYSEDSGDDYTPDNGTGDIIYTCFDIILIPHDGGTDRILSFSTFTKKYYWTLPDNLKFDSGKEYTVILEIDGSALNPVSVTIRDWGQGAETISIPIVQIPAGEFWMGSPDGETEITWASRTFTPEADTLRRDDGRECPMHKAKIDNDFYMSKYEITTSQYCSFLNANKAIIRVVANGSNWDVRGKLPATGLYGENDHILIADVDVTNQDVLFLRTHTWNITYNSADGVWSPLAGFENHPINNVTWYGAYAFADWAGGRLPTEAEWEYACRGGDYFFGNTAYRWASYNEKTLGDYAWCEANNTPSTGGGYAAGTKPVGLKLPNQWGLYDMHGNVWEWCYDWYRADFYSQPEATQDNPVNTTVATNRVGRGGIYDSIAIICRSAYRGNYAPASIYDFLGFRVVFSL